MVVGAGAKVLGPFTVGRGSKVGAGAIVLKEVPLASRSVAVGAVLGAGESVAVAMGDALGLTEGLGLGCTIVSALLEQAVNRPTPTREITRRIQILFKAVRLLAAIVCRSESAYLRQSLPDLPVFRPAEPRRLPPSPPGFFWPEKQRKTGFFLHWNFMRKGLHRPAVS